MAGLEEYIQGLDRASLEQRRRQYTDVPLWQKALNAFTWPFQQIHKYAVEPFAAAVTSPFTPRTETYQGEGLPWLGRELAEYRAWKSPSVQLGKAKYPEFMGGGPVTLGVKGALETLPWLAMPGVGAVGQAGRAAGGVGRTLARGTLLGGRLAAEQPWGIAGALGQAGKVGRAVGKAVEYSPWGLAEKAAMLPFKGASALARGAGKKGAKLTDAEILEQAAKGAAPISDKYYVLETTTDPQTYRPIGSFKEVAGKKVVIPGHETHDAFIFKDPENKRWTISDARTGMLISSSQVSKDSVTKMAKTSLDRQIASGELQLNVDSAIKRYGLSPRYSEAAPPVTKGAEAPSGITPDITPTMPESYVQARKRPDGKWQLFFTGTRNEVFPNELFASASEAKMAFRVAKAKGAEPIPPTGKIVPEKGIAPAAKEPWMMTREEFGDTFWIRATAKLPSGEAALPNRGLAERGVGALADWRGSDAGMYAATPGAKIHLFSQKTLGIKDKAALESGMPRITGRNPDITIEAQGWKDPHRIVIEQALAEGKPVPPEVLKDYPDLAAKSITPPAPKVEQATIAGLKKKVGQASYAYEKAAATPGGDLFKAKENLVKAQQLLGEAQTKAQIAVTPAAPAAEGAAEAQRHTLMLRAGGPLPTKMTTTVVPGGEPIALRAAGGGMPPIPPTGAGGVPLGGGRPPPTGGGATGAAAKEWDTSWLRFNEQLNDIFYGSRKAGGEDFITHLSRTEGLSNAAITRAQLVYREAMRVAPDVGPDPVADFLRLARSAEVLVEKPGRKIPGGFNTLQEIKDQLANLHASLGDAKYNQVMEAAKVVRDAFAFDRQRLVGTGRITQKVADEWAAKYPWYSPWRYLQFAEEQIKQGKGGKVFRVGQGGVYRLSDEGIEDMTRSIWEVMPERLMEVEKLIGTNDKVKALLGSMRSSGLPVARVKSAGPNILSIWENGQREFYEVPPWVYREVMVLAKQANHPIVDIIGKMNALSRMAYTALSPPFAIANMLNDSLTAFLNRGLLPHETVARLLATVKGLGNDKVMQAFRLGGGYQARFVDLKRFSRDIYATGGTTWRYGPTLKQKIIDAVPSLAERGEQATREAIFKKELNRLLPNWRTMTAEQIAATNEARQAVVLAIEGTINFGRGGYLIKAANPMLVFLNANMEAIKLPFRALRDNPAARWRLAGAAAGVTGLTAYNLSYPEYFDIPDSIRWGSIVVMLPSKEKDAAGNPKPNYVTVIPRTREWATFLGSNTYALEKMFTDSPTDFGAFSRTLAPMTLPTSMIPAPPILQELFAQKANYDFYWQDPIVSSDLQVLPEKEQVNPWTSRTVAALAQGVGISPIRLQHGITSILGGAGRTATSVSDFILDMVKPIKTDEAVADFTEKYKKMKPLERIQAMSSLSPEERDAIMRELRQPEKQLPVISPVASRLMPGRGGQLYKTGQEQAAKILGVSVTETSKAGGILRKVSDKLNDEQRALDEKLVKNRITWRDWRDERKMLSREYQGALKAVGIVAPTAAQVKLDGKAWYDYLTTVNTIAGTMADRRDRGQMIYAAYRSIQPDEVGDNIDWATYYAQQDTFVASLSDEDKAILEAERLGRMTAVEQVYDKGQQMLRPYWQMVDQAWASYPPEFKLVYQEWQRLQAIDPREAKRFMFQYPQVAMAVRRIDMAKKQMKRQNPQIAQLLRMYYSY